jgi:hypothetical protein
MNKKYVKSKLKTNISIHDKSLNSILGKQKLERMNSHFLDGGNNMFEYNKMKKKLELKNLNDENPEVSLMQSEVVKEKKVTDWLDFKNQVKKEQFLVANISLRDQIKEEEELDELAEGDEENPVITNKPEIKDSHKAKKGMNPDEYFYNKQLLDRTELSTNTRVKKQMKVVESHEILTVLETKHGMNGIFHYGRNKEIRKETAELPVSYQHLIKRKANGFNNNVILMKPEIIASEKQKFYERTKNGDQKENQIMYLMSKNNSDTYNQKFLENKYLKENYH